MKKNFCSILTLVLVAATLALPSSAAGYTLRANLVANGLNATEGTVHVLNESGVEVSSMDFTTGSFSCSVPSTGTGKAPANYSAVIHLKGYLSFKITGITFSGLNVSLNSCISSYVSQGTLKFSNLVQGDIDHDDVIGIGDVNTILSVLNYGIAASDAADPECDLNADNLIGIDDLSALLTTYGAIPSMELAMSGGSTPIVPT